MSTAYSSAKQQYIGNGVTTEWGFDFPIKKHSELKVYLKRSGQLQVLLEEGVDYSFVTENTISFPINASEAKLQATDVLALQRESVFESEYNFSNQQRLEPEEVMHADDNLERQIQELKRDVTQAIRIQPTSNINTDEYFIAVESIYENLDNITNVSGISAEIVNCSDNISDISAVSSNIANVNAVGQSISNVNTVANNISSVNTVAGVSTDVTTVAGISTDVSTVSDNNANITTVATNISDVNTAATNIEAIKAATTAATNAAQSATNAANSATDSANSATDSANSATASATSANNSHIWAEGTDAQVQALGGVHSSKGWAEQSTNANISLTNSPYTTNRILEIPQDIKLELNNGTLTLKAGSKVYVPNGFESDGTTPKFDVVLISEDLTHNASALDINDYGFDVVIDRSTLTPVRLGAIILGDSSSGTTPPAGSSLFYNTATNTIKFYSSGTPASDCSFPICKTTTSSTSQGTGYVKSIDQVFNGLGYIGSTVFALPGVKVQIPNGRNEDGTYKSISKTVESVLKADTFTVDSKVLLNLINDVLVIGRCSVNANNDIWFDEKTGYLVRKDGNVSQKMSVIIANILSSTKISSFTPYNVDSVVNSSLSNLSAAGQAKFDAKANVSNTVTTDTVQAITGPKTFKGVVTAELEPINFVAKNPTMDVNETPQSNKYVGYDFRDKNNIRLGYIGISQDTNGTFQYEIQNPGNYIKRIIGITPPAASGGNEMITAGWFNSKMQVVSALPANPNPNVFYFIPE